MSIELQPLDRAALSRPAVADDWNAPVNALGYRRVMFAVDDLDDRGLDPSFCP
jgi:hypothetical protein